MMMLQKKNLTRWLRTLLNTTNVKKHNRGTQARTGRKMLLESLERREVFDAGWATAAYSSGNILDMDGDNAGNHYLTGTFAGATATFGNITLNHGSGSGSDIYVAKQDANGQFLWAAGAGNPSNQNSSNRAIAIDSTGNVVISGVFAGTA